MEYFTSSSGIQHVFSQCTHEAIIVPYKSIDFSEHKNKVFPSLTGSYHHMPRYNSLTYGKSTLYPNDVSNTIITRSTSTLSGPTVISKPRRRTNSMHYDPINDPHLRDYFERKFKMSSAKKRRFKEKKPGPNELYYRIKVKTGNVNNASTDANVFITIAGARGDINKKLLFNQYKSIKTENGYKFKFERNSENVFKIIGIDIGQINHIIVEHDGKDVHSSWFLKEVLLTNTKTGRSWLFEYNDWLSLDHGLKTTRIQLMPTRQIEKYIRTDYKIVVITGDKTGAGTDANVYITLFGPHNKSTQKFLLKNLDTDLFERGKTDVFKLKDINYVGPIRKIRIEHDNTGKSPGWFLERVVIVDLKDPKVNFYCLCSKWLDKNQDDGLICRDLIASEDPLAIKKASRYKITVFTGDKRGAGTDADVSIVLYGTVGDSGEWKLDNKANNFERGQIDDFIIECPSVGEIKKIRIGHNNPNESDAWYLDKIIIDDINLGRVYEFICGQWLERDKPTIFLYPTQGVDSSEKFPYNLFILTGDEKHADTDALVYIELIGGRNSDKSSGKINLKDCEFKRGKMTKTQIWANKMLSPIDRVIIGHDNSGSKASWFLSEVGIETPQLGLKQYFPCNKWLANDKDDGRIERILYEDTSRREEHGRKQVWDVTVYTSDKKNAGTDSKVFLALYGDQGKTDEIELKQDKKSFEKGKKDKFTIETEEIGYPYKLRVWHDNSGPAPGWHLDRIELENTNTRDKYYFICNRWLDKKEDDGEIIRELPAEGDKIPKPLPIVNYIVEVYTGKKTNAGTDADVFINLFGELGDTGDRALEKSQNKNKFERNQCDVFKIEAVTLKRLKKVRIGHNGKRAGAGWFLDKVIVRQENSQKYDQEFVCNRWLASDEDDGQLVRELFAETANQFLDKTTYNVKVKTGDVRNAGTDAKVTLKIFGTKGDTGSLALKNAEKSVNKFERGRVDEFKLEAEDIGKIEKIQIGHNGKGVASGWFLDNVEIDVPSKGYRYRFIANRWLDENEGDRLTEIEMYPSDVIKIGKRIPYVITVKTGKKRNAGTDANVFVQMYGLDGKTEDIILDNKSNNFESGKEEVFKIEAEDVGPLFKVRVGHDNKGSSPGWFLERMLIQRHAIKGSKRLKQSRKGSVISQDDGELENYYFFVDKWFAKDEDDRQIVRELIPTDQDGRPLIEMDEISYEVKVHTGNKSGAGTDANVFIDIYGQNGNSGERELRKSDKMNKFEKNQIDTFKVKAIDLGELHKIRIWHDNRGAGSAWYLEKVEIYDPNSNRMYLFNCQNWLSETDGDGKIMRELPAIDPAQLKRVTFRHGVDNLKDQFLLETDAITNTYIVRVRTSDIRNAGTDANVYIQLFGEKNHSNKIPLETSKTNKNKFERGNEDVFEIKEADIGDLKKIKIGHDGRGAGSGWHLKDVIIDAPKLGKRWKFGCDRWLDSHEDDKKIERELDPIDVSYEEYDPLVPYEISVFTSDIRNGDTTANPYIVLYGDEIHTKQVELCKNKTERSGRFKRGTCDRFVLELEDVGRHIRKIRIGHDNKGMSPGWHVDRVEIRRLKQSGKGSKIYVFPCGRWLARDEDDKAIERDLVMTKMIDEKYENGDVKVREKDVDNHLEMKKYQVDVYTGNVSGAGTNANVFLTLYGDLGDSGEKKLMKSLNHRDKFEKNQVDSFMIEAADLGQLFKCFVRHDDSGFSADWFLDRIEVIDGRDKYVFICERWLSKSKEDKKIERTLFEKNYKGPRITSTSSLSIKSNIGGSKTSGSDPRLSIRQHSPFDHHQDYDGPTIPYKITIRTGDEKNCGISSQAFIRLFGQKKSQKTERIMLQLAKRSRFEPGSSEIFQIDALDIGELAQIELGHDGVGAAESWFVKHVEIIIPLKGITYFIPCNSWLSTVKGDGKTIKTFNVDLNTKITSFRGQIPYKLTIYTGDVPKAGTDSDIKLQFFGSKGNSDVKTIEKIDNRFDRASIDTLNIELDDIGSLKKVRVSHDGKGARKEWFLDRIEMTNMLNRKQFVFVADQWLSKSRSESRGLSIDVPLFKNDEQTIGNTDYRITVKTSDISGAGTDANVYVVIFGETGDSGQLELKKSETNMNKFEKGKTDVFIFRDVLSLGEITKLRIWHDNSGNFFGNSDWHLDSVQVEDLGMNKTYRFECKKWLSKSKDDKQLVRELSPIVSNQEVQPGEKTTYEVIVQTADERDAGTKQNVEIVLFGKHGESRPLVLENTRDNKILRRGHQDEFRFKIRSVGELTNIMIAHVDNGDPDPAPQWICDFVKVKDTSTGVLYTFPVMTVFKLNKKPKVFDCEKKKESQVSAMRGLKNVEYEVVVVTGSEKGAGTGATGFITIYGKNGDSGKRELKKGFERDQKDVFVIECLDLGELKKVHLEHDNKSFKKDWYVDRVEITDKGTGNNYTFPCNKWLSKNKEDGEIERDLFPEEDRRSGSRLSSRSPRRDNFEEEFRSSPRKKVTSWDETPIGRKTESRRSNYEDELSSRSPSSRRDRNIYDFEDYNRSPKPYRRT